MNIVSCPRCRTLHPADISCPACTHAAGYTSKNPKKAGCLIMAICMPLILGIIALAAGAGISIWERQKEKQIQSQQYPQRLAAFETAMDEQVRLAVGPMNFYVSCQAPDSRCYSSRPLTRERFLQDARDGWQTISREAQTMADRYHISPQDRNRYLLWFERAYAPGWRDETLKPTPDSAVPVSERLLSLPAESLSSKIFPASGGTQPRPAQTVHAPNPPVKGAEPPAGIRAPNFLTPTEPQ